MGARFGRDLEWHLTECPGCGAGNAANAATCWQCERRLPPPDAIGSPSPPADAGAPAAPTESVAGAGAGSPTRRRNRLVVAALVGAVAMILAVGAWWDEGAVAHRPVAQASPGPPTPPAAPAAPGAVDDDVVPAEPATSERPAQPDPRRMLGLGPAADDVAQAASSAVAATAASDPSAERGCDRAVAALGLCSTPPAPKESR